MKTPLVPFQFTPITQNAAIAGSFWMFIPLHGPKGIVSSPPMATPLNAKKWTRYTILY